MRLVFRRARGTASLLLAATGATLIATALLTGLAGYGRAVVDAGARSAVAAASQEERSILVRGSAGGTPEELTGRDTALRARLADGLAGVPISVSAAGLAAGRQLSGPTGTAVPDDDGVVFASVVFLDDLAAHADLVAGAWPRPGGRPVQAALAEPVAGILGVGVGSQIPITDRVTRQVTQVTVVGVWAPRDARDPYWRLVPDVLTGVTPGSATYGPLAVDRADFLDHFVANASVAWLLEPDLGRATVATLDRLATAARRLGTELPEEVGLGSSGLATTRLDQLAQRLARADLVGRSALVTPMLLVAALGGYALLLVALLLTEQRRNETALLRARGAAPRQLVGLAAREALLVVLPAAVLAPLLAAPLLRLAARTPALAGAALDPRPLLDPVTWLVAGLAAAGCLLAMLGPALRRGQTYVGDLTARSRPSRRTVVQRAGVDVALVALAVLGWVQLRQYSTPLAATGGTGTLGIDPLLAAAPTVGVLAGAVIALRGLPPLARLVERLVDRRSSWTAATLGMWQAGRRPHAGPVLLLALAVAVSTLAWCLAATSERSLADQADHEVGTDLRLVETSGEAPPDRAEQLAELPAATVLPAWRDELRLATNGEPAGMLALPAAAAGPVVRYRADLAGGEPGRLLADLAAAEVTAPLTELPAGARRLTGRISTVTTSDGFEFPVRSVAVLVDGTGVYRRLPLGESRNGHPLRFDVALPARGGPLRLAGFLVESVTTPRFSLDWHLTALGVRVDGRGDARLPLRDPDAWRVVTRGGPTGIATVGDGTLHARHRSSGVTRSGLGSSMPLSFAVVPAADPAPVPVVATADALTLLGVRVGDETSLTLVGTSVPVRVVGSAVAVPGVPTSAALLVDLPSLGVRLFHDHALLRAPQEWWVATGPGGTAVARQAATLDGLRVLDRSAAAERARSDPYGVGARVALFGAALGAILLAAVGIGVDIRATARRRITEFAVLRTLGAGSRMLARALLVEQGFLAGLGVVVGLAVGIGVAATMAPLIILTPSAQRPVPTPLLEIGWLPVGGTALVLLLVALGLGGLTAVTMRGRVTAAQLRIGEDR
jgi:ABC-type antimicrobial peptide transport system, permease component